MLNYQTTSFHDALYARQLLGLKPAPEFAAWLEKMNIMHQRGKQLSLEQQLPASFKAALAQVQ